MIDPNKRIYLEVWNSKAHNFLMTSIKIDQIQSIAEVPEKKVRVSFGWHNPYAILCTELKVMVGNKVERWLTRQSITEIEGLMKD